MGFEIKGMKEFQDKLNKLSNNAKRLSGQHSIPIKELLTPQFLRSCSMFRSIDELFEASGFKVESSEDFKAIPDKEWDEFIRTNTRYLGWDDMLKAAGAEWTKKQLAL